MYVLHDTHADKEQDQGHGIAGGGPGWNATDLRRTGCGGGTGGAYSMDPRTSIMMPRHAHDYGMGRIMGARNGRC
jgi:hypothetical protein